MKIIFVLIIQVALLLSIKASSQTIISGGDVSGLWNLSGSPYIVQGDIILNGELIIEPGVEVLFDEGIRFNVFGKLIAEGNKTSRIIFKNNANFWGGIHFINSSEASILKYFEVAGVRNLVGYGGAISVENSNSTSISHGTVFNNSSENRGGGISLLNLENFTISHILLYENSLYSEDGLYSLKDGTAIHIASSLVNLLNITAVKNTFSNALSGSASTIYWDSNSEVKFTNCIIQNNESTSIGRSNEYDQFNISYSNINGLEDLIGLRKLVVGEGNYDAPPSFVDYENDNFSLLWNNFPMQASKPREIDGGDPSIHNDDGSISDIGALTFDQMGEYFPPGAWFSADKNRIQAGTSVQFNNNSQKGSLDIALYYWDFGDGNFSNEIAPEHIYSDYGRFDVSLTVTDTNGNSNTQNLTDFIVSGTIILEGSVSGEWNKFLSPYIISGDIIIPQNELLDIKPDVEVLFSGYYGIKVEGDLRSIGNEEERVIFTSLDTINFWNKNLHWNYFYYERELNGWKGIEFVGNNLNSIMKFTDISYFRNFYLSCGDTNYFGGAVRLNNADGFIFDNCRFVNNNGHGYGLGSSTCYKGACIKAYSSDIIVSNCVFENNEADYSVAIYTWNSDNTKIENNIFRNNYSMGGNVTSLIDLTGEAYFEVISDNRIVVKNNIIENNEVGGISLGSLEGNVLIEGNLINNNIGHGITTSLSSPIISRNRITNNIASEGVGIYTLPSFGIPQIVNNFISGNTITYYWGQGSGILCETNTYIVNNTITNNTSTGINGEAIYGDNATYTAINNILFNNPNGDYGQNRGDSAYAIVENNFQGDPIFLEENVPELKDNSPCIDAGTLDLPITLPEFDFFGEQRINGAENKIDIGAVEFIDYDMDNDGVEDDIDICPSTPPNQQVNSDGCLVLPTNNFTIESISETCPDRDNGKIIISTINNLDYILSIYGVDYSFTSSLTIDNLAPGTYNFCIKVPLESFEQCYNIDLAEGTTISGKSSVNSGKVSIDIEQGTAPYNVSINGDLILQTMSSSFSVKAIYGDLIEVSTSKSCEGKLSKKIDLADEVIASPNPTTGDFEISLPILDKEIIIELFTIQSQLISTSKYRVVNGKVNISLKDQQEGIYFVKVYLDEPVNLKIIKR